MDIINNTQQYVIFKLENEEYGIDIHSVKTIEKMIQITRVPKSPHYVRGVINLRGEVVPIIDLRTKFDFDKAEETENTRIIIVSYEDIVVGLIVDAASEVIEISKENIEDAPAMTTNLNKDSIYGVAKVDDRIIILFDVLKLIDIHTV